MKIVRRQSGFTLIELLVVISIVGILAGLAVPALKNLGKSDATVSAARQLLDDVGRARQLAMSQRTTVYMVFVPTNFWNYTTDTSVAMTNLCDKQLTGYTFIGQGTVGDQPGRHNWHYLAPWQNLPAGTFIAQQKFQPRSKSYTIGNFTVVGFDTNNIPFPLETASLPWPSLPNIAFNSLGRPVSGQDEYIPLAHGTVAPATDPATKAFTLNSPSVDEIPPGNSTNASYNVVHVDALTGRAVLEFQKVQ